MCDECGWNEVLVDIEEALADIPDLPERAEEFANSVDEKLRSIYKWIEENEHATERQAEAVENMITGIGNWLDARS